MLSGEGTYRGVEDVNLRDALAEYLVSMGMAEERAGYGHATGKQVANAVLTFLAEWTYKGENDGCT